MKRFVTEYQGPDGRYGGEVDALDYEHAQRLCDERGRGETVLGILFAYVPACQSFGNKQADAMTRAFAESGDDEPPDASDFPPLPEPQQGEGT